MPNCQFAPRLRLIAIASLLIAMTLAGCSGNTRDKLTNPDQVYEIAKKDLDDGQYANAIRLYEALEARFPFSTAARQGQLDLMYAYYKNREPESAIDQAEQFIRENPTHPRIDYAYYIKGLVSFERNPNFIERWFRADLSQRPPIDARKSFQAFQTIVQQYPNSQYAADARQRMVFLRNRLANYEVYVARHYLDRQAYVGAINRAKYTIENYDGAPATAEALDIMARAYDALGMTDLAAETRRVSTANFNSTEIKTAAQSNKPWWKIW